MLIDGFAVPRKKLGCLCGGLLSLLLLPFVWAEEVVPTPSVVHSVSGWSPAMKAFQRDLMETLLRLSAPEFGGYSIVFDDRYMTTSRSMLATRRGEIHSGFTTGWGALSNSEEHVYLYRYPYLKALLGLRRLIIREEDIDRFAEIKSIADLRQFRAGQGTGWPDSRVYRDAEVTVVEGENYSSLFPMLAKGRFDFLPLSILEVDTALAEAVEAHPDLVIAESLYVFYPVPLYISVSNTRPDIAARLDKALRILFDPLSPYVLDSLISRHFPLVQEVEINESMTLISLDNPYTKAEINSSMKAYFNTHYRRVVPQ